MPDAQLPQHAELSAYVKEIVCVYAGFSQIQSQIDNYSSKLSIFTTTFISINKRVMLWFNGLFHNAGKTLWFGCYNKVHLEYIKYVYVVGKTCDLLKIH